MATHSRIRSSGAVAVVTITVLLIAGCGSGPKEVAAVSTPAAAPSPTVDAAVTRAAADALRKTSTLPTSIQGHTKDFFGKDGSTLSAVASEYQLAASDLDGYASKVGDAGPAITSLASALDAVSTCLGGLDGDFYLSSVDRECVAAYAAVQTRMAESLSALDRL